MLLSLETLRLQNLLMDLCVAWEMLLSQLHIQEVSSSSQVSTPVASEGMQCSIRTQPSLQPPGISMTLAGLFLALSLSLVQLNFWLVCHLICCSYFHGKISLLLVVQHKDLYYF